MTLTDELVKKCEFAQLKRYYGENYIFCEGACGKNSPTHYNDVNK